MLNSLFVIIKLLQPGCSLVAAGCTLVAAGCSWLQRVARWLQRVAPWHPDCTLVARWLHAGGPLVARWLPEMTFSTTSPFSEMACPPNHPNNYVLWNSSQRALFIFEIKNRKRIKNSFQTRFSKIR